ncbi:MAG: NusG domain II-containing protein [Defluviitaleaceae bacterium]|nr:NusG domain II-containing protein [Defluviitaleaceae bacterium]
MTKTSHIKSIVVISIIILTTILAFAIIAHGDNRIQDMIVIISVQDETLHVVDLNQNEMFTIVTTYGENTILIENGRVSMTSSNCADSICMSMRPIYRLHESIVCIPNRIHIKIATN